jgi:hypothetical protein
MLQLAEKDCTLTTKKPTSRQEEPTTFKLPESLWESPYLANMITEYAQFEGDLRGRQFSTGAGQLQRCNNRNSNNFSI